MVDKTEDSAAPVKDDPPKKKKETDELRSKRRSDELSGFLDTHMERVAQVHKDYPTPFGVKFQDMILADQERWNQKRVVLDKANRDYHYAIKDAVQRHANEEVV